VLRCAVLRLALLSASLLDHTYSGTLGDFVFFRNAPERSIAGGMRLVPGVDGVIQRREADIAPDGWWRDFDLSRVVFAVHAVLQVGGRQVPVGCSAGEVGGVDAGQCQSV
jgi:hypothetical protein